MTLLACGINHKTTSLAVREKLVFTDQTIEQPLLTLANYSELGEAAILSTCNRTEFYCPQGDAHKVVQWLKQKHRLDENILYIYKNEEAVRHLLRVAAGLDSLVLGESQVLGQVKNAFSLAEKTGTLGKNLRRLSEYVFAVTKEIRTQTDLGVHRVSIASVAVDLVQHIFAEPKQLQVLCIGAGETIDLAVKHLQNLGVTQFIIANRTLQKAENLAQSIDGKAIALTDVPDYLPQADMVICATQTVLPLLGKGLLERTLKVRRYKPMLLIDLGVPRNIEQDVSKLADAYLYTIDDLQNLSQQNLAQRQQAATQAEKIIANKANHYMRSLKVLDAVPLISDYRDKAGQLRDQELQKALRQMASGLPAEQVLQQLAHTLTNKLIHAPSTQIRAAAYAEDETFLLTAKKLLGLD